VDFGFECVGIIICDFNSSIKVNPLSESNIPENGFENCISAISIFPRAFNC
jgi:hypothetical protein